MEEEKNSKLRTDRQYLIKSIITRTGFITTIVFGIILLFGPLLGASLGGSGQHIASDTSEYQTIHSETTGTLASLKNQPEIKVVQAETENTSKEAARNTEIEGEEVAEEGISEVAAGEEVNGIVDNQDLFLYDDSFDLLTRGVLKLQASFPNQTEEDLTGNGLAYLWLGDEDSDGIYFGVDRSTGTLLFLNNGDGDSIVPITPSHGEKARLAPDRIISLSLEVFSDGTNLTISFSPKSIGPARVQLDAEAIEWLDMAAIKVGVGAGASPSRFCVTKDKSNCLRNIEVTEAVEEETDRIIDDQDLFLYNDSFDLSTGGPLELQARFPYQSEEDIAGSGLAYLWFGNEDSGGIYFGVDYSAGTLLLLNNGDEDSSVSIMPPDGPHGETVKLTLGRSIFLSMKLLSDGNNLFLTLSPTSGGVARVQLDAGAIEWLDMAAIKVGVGSSASPETFCVIKGRSDCLKDIVNAGIKSEEKVAEENSEEAASEGVSRKGSGEEIAEETVNEESVKEEVTEKNVAEETKEEIVEEISKEAEAVEEEVAEEVTGMEVAEEEVAEGTSEETETAEEEIAEEITDMEAVEEEVVEEISEEAEVIEEEVTEEVQAIEEVVRETIEEETVEEVAEGLVGEDIEEEVVEGGFGEGSTEEAISTIGNTEHEEIPEEESGGCGS